MSHIEMFAKSYPKGSAGRPVTLPPLSMRTPLQDVVSEEAFHPKQAIPKQAMTDSAKEGTKKFLAIFLITILGALLFSTFAYTMSDHVFGKMGMQLFDENGSPSTTIIVIHSIIFLMLIYFVLGTLKWSNK